MNSPATVSGGGFSHVIYTSRMFVPSNTTIILAVIGFIGILATGVVTTYAFRRNRTSNGRYQ